MIEEQGRKDGRIGAQNAWPVDMLQPGDVYVCDHFELKEDGPSIGDNVGNSIYAKSGNGIVYNGAVRDIVGLNELENFTSFVRSYHPSHHFPSSGPKLNSTMVGINCPTRIGKAVAMPGDVVLGRDGGVLFIPPQLAEKVVKTSEIVRLHDLFGHQRLREGKYTPGQIDAQWSDEIERDFSGWLKERIDKLPCRGSRSKSFSRSGADKGKRLLEWGFSMAQRKPGRAAAGSNREAGPRTPAQMKDVAAHAGVSITTVSHIINDTRDVAPATRERVLAAMRELNYYKNAFGRRLARGRSDSFGLIISDIENPFFAELIKSYERSVMAVGCDTLLFSTDYDRRASRKSGPANDREQGAGRRGDDIAARAGAGGRVDRRRHTGGAAGCGPRAPGAE